MSKKLYFFIVFSLIIVDQLSKYLIRHFGGFYICNSNVALGIRLSHALFYVVLFFIAIFLITLANSKLKITNPKQFRILDFGNLNLFRIWDLGFRVFKSYWIESMLIFSGALSNIIDRLTLGCITDFIDLKFWPVFNLADIFIVFGAIMLISHNFKRIAHNEK
jgi:lipoprotein signal peptidase